MNKTKVFSLSTVLTVTTGRMLLVDRERLGMKGLFNILDWMTKDTLFIHQIGRATDECKPWLYRWFPELGTAEASNLLGRLDEWIKIDQTSEKFEGIKLWMTELQMMDQRIKSLYAIPRIPTNPEG